MKIKHIILRIVAASMLLVFILFVAIFNSRDEEWLIQFLNQYGAPEQRSPWATKYQSGEHVRYHFKADYDTFIEAAKSVLLAQGFSDITEPNEYYKLQVYEKQALEHIRVQIRFAIIRGGPAVNNPINFWIDVQVMRTKPKFSFRKYWNYFRGKYLKIRSNVKHNQP